MSEVNIQVQETIENVEIVAQNNVIDVNITRQSGGGGGAVDSVNGQTGVVVLDADDISDASTSNKFVTASEKTAITHSNRSTLDAITEAFTTTLKTAYDSAVAWISTNGANLLNHLTNTSNPHNTTATQVDALQRDGSNANSNINIGEYSFKAGQFELDQSPTGTAGVAITRWNDAIGSTETTLKGGNVVLKNGVDLVARVVNKVTPNTTLTKASYQAVRVSSAQGQRLAVSLAQANNDNNSADTIGLVCETIATNQEGFIITVGQLEGINTTGSLQGETWADGDVLYLSPTTAGRLTNVKPSAPSHIVVIGYVEYAHAVNGKIYVKIMNGWELDELHNVAISSPTNNQVLAYTSSTQLWENKSVATVTDISLTSTIVGWSSFTVRDIRVIDLGSFAIVFFRIQGTSNSTAASFTLPFNSTVETSVAIRTINNGINQTATGLARIVGSSNIVECFQNLSFMTFASSNSKLVIGQILITK
jgi:hypothetical protein